MPITIKTLTENARDVYKSFEEHNKTTYWTKGHILENFLIENESKGDDAELNHLEFSNGLIALEESTQIGKTNLKNIISILVLCDSLQAKFENKEIDKDETSTLLLTMLQKFKVENAIAPNFSIFSNHVIRFCYDEIGLDLSELYEPDNTEKSILLNTHKSIATIELEKQKLFEVFEGNLAEMANLRKNNEELLQDNNQYKVTQVKYDQDLMSNKKQITQLEKSLMTLNKNYKDLERNFMAVQNELALLKTNHSIAESNEIKKLNAQIDKLKESLQVKHIPAFSGNAAKKANENTQTDKSNLHDKNGPGFSLARESSNSAKKVADVASDFFNSFTLYTPKPLSKAPSSQPQSQGLNNKK